MFKYRCVPGGLWLEAIEKLIVKTKEAMIHVLIFLNMATDSIFLSHRKARTRQSWSSFMKTKGRRDTQGDYTELQTKDSTGVISLIVCLGTLVTQIKIFIEPMT